MISKTIIAIICITALEVVAMLCDIDGAAFGVAIAAVAGLGGYEVHAARVQQKKDKDK